MGTVEINYTVRYTDNAELAGKSAKVSAANADMYQESFTESVINESEYNEYRTGRKFVIVSFWIEYPEVVESKNATSSKGIL